MHHFKTLLSPLIVLLLLWITLAEELIENGKSVDTSVKILSYEVNTKIRLRYSQTQITSVVRNTNHSSAAYHTFETILPNSAYLSDFNVEINGRITKGSLSAKNATGGSSPISLWVRNANIVSVNVLLAQSTQAKIVLAYNEILERGSGYYQHTTYIRPEMIGPVSSLKIVTDIDETSNLQFVRVPFNQHDAIETNHTVNRTEVEWHPTRDGETNSPCSVAQYTVQYDVNNEDDGEVIIIDGFFFHFFVPFEMDPLRKHVVFILDVSGSMSGERIAQLITAMIQILGDLKNDDYFNIIEFSSAAKHWRNSTHAIEASDANIADAKAYVQTLRASGGTSANAAFNNAFQLIRGIKNEQSIPESVETIMFFLTDGEPTDASKDAILSNVRAQNNLLAVPIYSLAFGRGADTEFLNRISLQNYGFSKEIFEGLDAAEQLKDFYDAIASPLLTNVQISYASEDFDITNLTVTNFTSINDGAAVKVSGKLTPKIPGLGPFKLTVIIEGQGRDGIVTITKDVTISPITSKSIQESDSARKQWAHVTIQTLIDDYLATGSEIAKQTAQDLALQHGFVIPYTTMSLRLSRCTADTTIDPIPIQPIVGTNCSTATNIDEMKKIAQQYITHSLGNIIS